MNGLIYSEFDLISRIGDFWFLIFIISTLERMKNIQLWWGLVQTQPNNIKRKIEKYTFFLLL